MMSSNDEPRILSDKITVTDAERRLKYQNPGPSPLQQRQGQGNRHPIESQPNHRPPLPPPPPQHPPIPWGYGHPLPPIAGYYQQPLPWPGQYPPPSIFGQQPNYYHCQYYQTAQFGPPSDANLNTGYPAHHPAHHRHHGHYSHATKQPVLVNTTQEQSIPTVTPCNSNEDQSIPTVLTGYELRAKQLEEIKQAQKLVEAKRKRRQEKKEDEEATRKRQRIAKQCDRPGCTELTCLTQARFCPEHYGYGGKHQCDRPGCTELRKEGTQSRFCSEHYGKQPAVQQCDRPGCTELRKEGTKSRFCSEHYGGDIVKQPAVQQCDRPGCTELRKEGTQSRFCSEHYGGISKGGRQSLDQAIQDIDHYMELNEQEACITNGVSITKTAPNEMRYHPSLRRHIIKHGLAMLAYLESRSRVEAEEKPSHDIGHLIVVLLDNKGDGGIYTAWKIVDDAMKKKHGSTKKFLRRFLEYLEDPAYQYKIDDEYAAAYVQLRINMEKLETEEDAALCHCYDKFMRDIKNDPKVPHYIKRVLCEKIRERGGERLGPKKTIIYQLIEAALQRKDGLGVILEGLQWNDRHHFGMIAKVEEAVAAVKPIIQHVNTRADLPVPSMMSWPPGENREDQLYNKPCATDYVGSTSKRSAFDGPAIPDWKTHDERYSKEYSIRRFNTANEEIDDFILEAWKLRETGCLFLLDKNELACSKDKKIHIRLTNLGFEKEASIYDGDIEIWRIEKAVVLVHVPLCVGGSIMAYITIKKLQTRCIVIDTIRGIVSMAKGEEVNGPMLAIEAGMAQRLLHNGLHQSRMVCAAFFRDYLTPAEVNAFDLYGGSNHTGPIKNYPDYPITKKNRNNYIRN